MRLNDLAAHTPDVWVDVVSSGGRWTSRRAWYRLERCADVGLRGHQLANRTEGFRAMCAHRKGARKDVEETMMGADLPVVSFRQKGLRA